MRPSHAARAELDRVTALRRGRSRSQRGPGPVVRGARDGAYSECRLRPRRDAVARPPASRRHVVSSVFSRVPPVPSAHR
ncbi:hypothetical protein QJS66_16515 [Kocuria rhizophila]|nr:hypothetical protein QJS66_16515 [Kocuria rhizophila]